MVGDPNGKLDITRHAGYWLRNDDGKLTKAGTNIRRDGPDVSECRDDEAEYVG